MAPSRILVPDSPVMEMKRKPILSQRTNILPTPPDSPKDAKTNLIIILTSMLNYLNSVHSDDSEENVAQDIFLRLNPGISSTNIEMMLAKLSEQNCTWEKASHFMGAIERVDRIFGYEE